MTKGLNSNNNFPGEDKVQLFHFYLEKLEISDKIKYLTMTDAKKVWMPDTFFRNEKIGRFHNILAPNMYVRIFPNGDIFVYNLYIGG